MHMTNYRRDGRRPTGDEPEVLVWYKVHFKGGPWAGQAKWMPAPVAPYHPVPGPNGGVLSSQYRLVRVMVLEPWRAYARYEYHYPSR